MNRKVSLPPDVVLRPYEDSDREAVAALRALAFSVLAANVYSPEQLAASRAHAETPAFAGELRRINLMLAVDRSGALLGAAGWSTHEGEPETGRIRKVFVHPQWARKGLGTALVLDAERRAEGAGHARFAVRASLNAVSFYRRLGYRTVESQRVPRPGDVGVPVMLMRKP
jgi:putative acetyltransferase